MAVSDERPDFLSELRRRRVLHVAGAYIAIAWLVTEIASYLLTVGGAPRWSFLLLAIVFVAGFPLALVLAWVIRKQPDGKWSIDSSSRQGRTITVASFIALLAIVGLSWLILPRMNYPPPFPEYDPLPNSVAILPLADAGSTPNERTVAETLYTALLQGLKQSRELTQVQLRLKNRPQDPVVFGRRMRVVALLDGHLEQVPGGTRIEMALLDVGRGQPIWSQIFDWDPTRIMETGAAIANGVFRAMGLPGVSQRQFAGTDNREAYDALLLGHKRFSTFRLEDVEAAIDYFESAINLDPDYGPAYASLGSALLVYRNIKGPSNEERQTLEDRAREALETAVKLDDESADAISALGWIAPNREIRIRLYEHALELDPNHKLSYHRLGWQTWSDGNLERAATLFQRALELDPMNANQHHDLGELYWEMGRHEDARAEILRSIELEPDMSQNFLTLGLIELWSDGRIDNAIIDVRKAYSLSPENGSYAGFLAGAYAGLGARKQALAWSTRSLELSPTGGWALNMAYLTHLMLGEEDAAMEYVERVLEMDPRDHRALFFAGRHDIQAGRSSLALDRWRRAYPMLIASNAPHCDDSNYHVLVAYANNLMLAGLTEAATGMLKSCRPVVEAIDNPLWPEAYPSFTLALLGQEKAALAALRREIVDGHRRIETSITFDQPEYDFLRDNPEFQRLMAIIAADLGRQWARIQELESRGDLATAPEVKIEP